MTDQVPREYQAVLGVAVVFVGGLVLWSSWQSSAQAAKSMSDSLPPLPSSNRPESIYRVKMVYQPFPQNNPGAIIMVPAGFRMEEPVDLVVYFRGFGSCIEVIAGDQRAPCRPGGTLRRPSHILQQFRDARKNAVLVMPELLVEAADTNPGTFGRPGGFDQFVQELLVTLARVYDSQFPTQVRSIAIYAHSGGWGVTSHVVQKSSTPVRDVVLLDAFYGGQDVYLSYALNAAQQGFPAKRFVSVHTGGRPTDNTITLARAVRARFPASIVTQPVAGTPTAADMQHPVFIKASQIDHSNVPSFYFGRILQSSYLTNF